MQINIIPHGHLHLSEDQNTYIMTKMEKILHLSKRIQDESSKVEVRVNKDDTKAVGDRFTCSITLIVPRETLRSEAQAADPLEAVDKAKPKLIQQIDKYKEKWG